MEQNPGKLPHLQNLHRVNTGIQIPGAAIIETVRKSDTRTITFYTILYAHSPVHDGDPSTQFLGIRNDF